MIVRQYRFFLLLSLSLVLAAGGCSVHFQEGPLFEQINAAKLPADPLSLVSLAHSSYSPFGPSEAVALSLVASQKALALRPGDEIANFQAARAALWLLEFGEELSKEQRQELAEKGFESAQKALEKNGSRVDAIFLSGSLLGFKIQMQKKPPLIQLRKVRDYFAKSVEVDASYNGGGPLRAFGTLLVKAPGWPVGVGDFDLGLEYLEQAAKEYPSHPANHLFYAEALLEDDQEDEAAVSFKKVLSLCKDERWGAVCETYSKKAGKALEPMGLSE